MEKVGDGEHISSTFCFQSILEFEMDSALKGFVFEPATAQKTGLLLKGWYLVVQGGNVAQSNITILTVRDIHDMTFS